MVKKCSLLLLSVVALAGCQGSPGDTGFKVVCTTGMVADLARVIGGDDVKVQQLMGPGVDPHLYSESIGDIAALRNADLILYSGLHLEGKMADTLANMGRTRPTCAVAEKIDPKLLLGDGGKAHDPHVWFDVSLWSEAAEAAREALAKADPKNAAKYNERAAKYRKELDDLHAEVKKQISTIPKERRVLITAHDAFEYFGRAYDIEVKGIQGISTDAEASVRHIEDLVKYIAKRGVKAVFVESSVNKDNVESLITGCRAAGHDVKIGGELFSDAMGAPGTPEGNYIGMVRHNVRTIVDGLK